MCGIAGILHFDNRPADPSTLQAMTDILGHRGPDGQGIHCAGPLGLGHRRLAIVDRSEHGAQPMAWPERQLLLTYNGEIFNFREVRRELQSKGHGFHSQTDSEVLLHAYAEWGEDCLRRLNGMFAFALWDGKDQSLWLVRDRLGVKPLFYAFGPGTLVFGSEIKALLCHPDTGRDMDTESLAYYLALNYVPQPRSLFRAIRQLPPAHSLRVTLRGESHLQSYWEWRPAPEPMSEKQVLREFADHLQDSVRTRLLADVPVGCFLSGGLDSSAIAWAARQNREELQTFSLGFSDARFDESARAAKVAAHIGTRHQADRFVAAPLESLPKVIWHAEEPTADSSMLGLYRLAGLAREKVTVALSGDGADEILAGYPTYPAFFLHRFIRKLPVPNALWRGFAGLVDGLLPSRAGKVGWDEKLRRFSASLGVDSERVHGHWRLIQDAEARRELLAPIWDSPEARADAGDIFRRAFSDAPTSDALAKLLWVDAKVYLPSDMLIKADRMGMAHGLEIRTPFLDYQLVEWLGRVPSKFKLRHGRGKWLLRRYLRGKVPPGFENGPKRGFNMPVSSWLRHEMKDLLEDRLNPLSLQAMPYLNAMAVRKQVREHLSGRKDHGHALWGLLSLKLWSDTFTRNGPPRKPGG